MAFICECKPRPGALSLEKCLQLGVPKGPLLGKLKNGETLTLENGTVVYPADVRDPDDPGPIFLGLNTIDNISVFCELNNYWIFLFSLVIDIPSIGYLRNLRKNEQFKKYMKSNSDENLRSDLILHFTPTTVMDTVEYKEFIATFSEDTMHMVLNERNK